MCFGSLSLESRKFGLQRFVPAPMQFSDMVTLCAKLVLAAMHRRDRNVIAVLLGLQEIISTKRLVHQHALSADPPLDYHCDVLHSDVLGNDEEEHTVLSETGTSLPLLVSSCHRRLLRWAKLFPA